MQKHHLSYGSRQANDVSVDVVEVLMPAEASMFPSSIVRIGHDGTPFSASNGSLFDTDAAARAEAAKFCRNKAAEWNQAARGFEGK
jgi:hypothetical protein